MALLRKLLEERVDEYVFPGGKKGRPLSNMALITLLHRMGRRDIVPHGFRSPSGIGPRSRWLCPLSCRDGPGPCHQGESRLQAWGLDGQTAEAGGGLGGLHRRGQNPHGCALRTSRCGNDRFGGKAAIGLTRAK